MRGHGRRRGSDGEWGMTEGGGLETREMRERDKMAERRSEGMEWGREKRGSAEIALSDWGRL